MKWLKRLGLAVLALVIVGAIGFFGFLADYVGAKSNNVIAHDPYPVSDEARALHDTLFVGDWHADSLLWERDLNEVGYGQVDFPRLRQGGVALQVFTAVTKSPAGLNYEENSAEAFDNITLLSFGQLRPVKTWTSLLARAEDQAMRLHEFRDADPERIKIIRSKADLDALIAARAANPEVVGALLGVEGAHPLEGKIENLARLEAAGYRLIGLQHFFDNELGGSLHGTSNAGLTDFGREVVDEVVRRGLILDLAHSSQHVIEDVLARTDIPLVVSHTGLHSHCEVKRNLPDALLREVAARGGVIGMGYWAEVACDEITPAGIAKMIVAAVAAVGEDGVSLGSDYDGSVETAFDTSELPALTHALLEAGLTPAQIGKVMGGNMQRVIRARLQ
ncbi:membrane dipeptidase [Litorivita sp. NS0012-18]|uniref:dipeptidase n=1 Tax=Litorivita sp. NS0012-18 TaxID=3127655 RepID=UPI003107AF81